MKITKEKITLPSPIGGLWERVFQGFIYSAYPAIEIKISRENNNENDISINLVSEVLSERYELDFENINKRQYIHTVVMHWHGKALAQDLSAILNRKIKE